MSERDSVHKEIEKLQDEVQDSKKKVIIADSRAKHFDEEVTESFHFNHGFANKIPQHLICSKDRYCSVSKLKTDSEL